MARKATIPNWYRALKAWIRKPCPGSEWLYRGQSARYETVISSSLRPQNRSLYRDQLYDVDYGIAERIFASSPVFGDNKLFPYQITDSLGLRMADVIYSIGGVPTYDPRLSFPELARALAQHYDFPTLFIDVSFHPLVGAMFATHRFTASGYVVDEEEASVLFRWPAQRKSPARLTISGEADGRQQCVNVIDISRTMRFMRRPAQQQAALATPAFDPRPFYQPFSSPVEKLQLTDMARLSSCERCVLPPGAGRYLAGAAGLGMAALFPDRIDLGYSYLSVIALLSMIVHEPREDSPHRQGLQEMYESALDAARAVLDRECLRLVSDCPTPRDFHRSTLSDAWRLLKAQIGTARNAIAILDTEEIRRAGEAHNAKRQETIRAEAQSRCEAWTKAVGEVIGPDVAAELAARGVPEYTVRRRQNTTWALPELDRRTTRVDSIVKSAELCPVYALEDPLRFQRIRDAFERPAAYEQEVLKQLAASREWRKR